MSGATGLGRVTRLFSRTDAAPIPVDGSARQQTQRQLYADVGDFLFAHDLAVTEANFAVALAHMSADARVSPRIDALLREHATLTDTMLADIHQSLDAPIKPEVLADVAEKLASTLSECVHLIGQSSTSVADYGAKLDLEVATFQADPLGALDRLIRMTSEVVGATRAMEERLDTTRRETTRLRTNLQRARREADRDHLTGLPNRRHLESRMAALASDGDHMIGIVDIDDFKHVNDTHGHETGDRVLRYMARLLKSQLGDRAFVARYGGEEFALLFEACGLREAQGLVDSARAILQTRALVNQTTGEPIGAMSFSGGIAPITGDPRAALRAADAALYEAKRSGKNRVHVAIARDAA